MSGIHVGRLNVYSTDLHGKENLLWRLFGDQNNTWNEASFPVNVSWLQYQVIIDLYSLVLKVIQMIITWLYTYANK